MNQFERFFVGVVGYTYDMRSGREPEDYKVLSMVGLAIVLASLLSGVNAGVAAWVFTEGVLLPWRVALSVVASIFVLLVVLTMDRQAIYVADTALQINPKTVVLQLACRVVFVLCIGAASSQAILPLVLRAELQLTALEMKQEKARENFKDVEGQLGLDRKRDELRSSETRMKALEAAQATLPADITQRFAAANACWSNLAAERHRAQQAASLSADQIRVFAARGASCRSRAQEAQSQRDRYQADTRRALDEARQATVRREGALGEAEGEARRRQTETEQTVSESLTERSADVLAETLSRKPGARAKWFLLTSIQLLLELLPLLMKLSAGQSVIGLMYAYRKRFIRLDYEAKEREQRHEADVKAGLQQAAALSAQDLSESPAVRAVLQEEFMRSVSSCAPFRTFESYVTQATEARDLERQSRSKYPDLAHVISAAFVDSLRRATEMMASDMRGKAAP